MLFSSFPLSSFFCRFSLTGKRKREDGQTARRAKRRDERRRGNSFSSSSCSSFSSQASSPNGKGTDDSDSRAKSYSFGPSTTWPRHNRVKVASRLSPTGWLFRAREVFVRVCLSLCVCMSVRARVRSGGWEGKKKNT